MTSKLHTFLSAVAVALAVFASCGTASAAVRSQSQNRYKVSGRVVEHDTDQPVYMASVFEKETGLWATTDVDGRFELDGVSAGAHNFVVSVLGYEERVLRFPSIKGDVTGLNVILKISSLSLDEVVVTAKEGGEITSASKIAKQTIEHVQPASLTDIMQLLPGSVTENPSLTSAANLSIRDIGTNSANAAGTALIVDGASFTNDANMQVLSTGSSANASSANVASTAGGGVDSRQVSTDNIESVEVIRGIPSVIYGDLTSGAVVVKTKSGATPWEVRLKADPKLTQVYLGKGFNLGGESGVVNFDADYALAFSDVRTQASAYNRFNFQLGYSNNFAGKLTFNAKFRANYSNATNAADADLKLDEIQQERDYGFRFNINGKWIVDKPWLTNVEYLVAAGTGNQLSRSKTYQGSAGYTPATASMQAGEALAFFTDPQYYSDVYIYGKPQDAQARIVANQFGTYGKVTNKVLLGFEWKMQGNTGKGKEFAVDCPPSPGSSTAYRERSYSDVPFLHRYTGFIEDNVKFPAGPTSFEFQLGARFNGISARGLDTKNFTGIEPRFNGKFNIIKKRTGWRELSIRGGWGRSFKMPSMIYLYPEAEWCDLVSFSYNDFDANNYGLAVITTGRRETLNADLKVQQSTNIEAGIEFDAGPVSGSVVYYNENMINGYGFVTNYVPMEYRRYGYVWDASGAPSSVPLGSGAYPEYSGGVLTSGGKEVPYIVDTTFMAFSTPSNDIVNKKWGIEFTLDIARIKAINTSINISGAYMNMTTTNSGINQRLYSGQLNKRTFPYVGLYAGSSTMSNGSVRERLSANVRFITHIPSISMVVTLTAQMVFMDCVRYTSTWNGESLPYFYDENGVRISGSDALNDTQHTKLVNPLSIMDMNGNIVPFTREMEKDPKYANLILPTNVSTYYLRQNYPFYGMLNIRISKEIKKIATISFYANNFLNLKGRVKNSVTQYPSDKNTPIYFGAEVKVSLKPHKK